MTTTIYLASSMITYTDPAYDQAIDHIKHVYPGSEILAARDLYASHGEWLNQWPGILTKADKLIFFTDRNGFIGLGVYQEILDSLAAGKEILYMDAKGKLIQHDRVKLNLINESHARFARVMVSRKVG